MDAPAYSTLFINYIPIYVHTNNFFLTILFQLNCNEYMITHTEPNLYLSQEVVWVEVAWVSHGVGMGLPQPTAFISQYG